MRIIVTGADGYLGSGIVQKLLEYDCEVYGFGLSSAPEVSSARFHYAKEDVFAIDSETISACAPDVVIHLAWRNGFKHGDSSHIEDLFGHYCFVKKCVDAGVPKLAVMGSMHEVGYHEGAVSEDTPCVPTTPYAIAKNALRQLAINACSGSKTTLLWMRGFYIVSADTRGGSIFSKIISAEERGDATFPFTSGANMYDFLDYPEFCKKVAQLVLNERAVGIINVCSGKPETLASRVERFIKDGNLKIKLQYGAYPDRPYDSPGIWGEISGVDTGDCK